MAPTPSERNEIACGLFEEIKRRGGEDYVAVRIRGDTLWEVVSPASPDLLKASLDTLPPANLNDPDKQEALAEGEEAWVVRRWCGTHEQEVAARARLCKERCAQWGKCDDLDGSCYECTMELTDVLPCPRAGCPHKAPARECDCPACIATKALTSLSRTHSSPQADEADVERVARAIGEARRRRCGGYPWEGDPALDPWLTDDDRSSARAAIATMTTRPAGGEEVENFTEALHEMAVGYGLGSPGSRAIVTAIEHARATALTKPAALPKGEDLEQLVQDARVAACGTRLTCREREVIRALCDVVEGRGALPKEEREDARLRIFLEILSAAGGETDASDARWNWINAFCEGHEGRSPDTYNRANDLGYVNTLHDPDASTSTAYLTPKGREYLSSLPVRSGEAWSDNMAEAPRSCLIYDPKWGVVEGLRFDGGEWGLASFNGQLIEAHPTHWRHKPAAPSRAALAPPPQAQVE